jgi:hypothetical protein
MAGDEQRKESKMKNMIKVTSLITLAAAAVLAASIATVSGARAQVIVTDPIIPAGDLQPALTPTPQPGPNNVVRMADPGFDTIVGQLQPIIPAGDLQIAPQPAPNNNLQIAIPDCWDTVLGCREPNPDILKELQPVAGGSGNQDGSDNAGGPNDTGASDNPGGSSDTDGSNDSGGTNNTDGSSNPSGSSDPSASVNSGDPSLPNAGTGTASSATDGGQSSLIPVILIIAGFAVALALLFTAWRIKRSEW